jgi:hypothetical protein
VIIRDLPGVNLAMRVNDATWPSELRSSGKAKSRHG